MSKQDLFHDEVGPVRVRNSFLLGSLDLVSDGAGKSKLNDASNPTSSQPELHTNARLFHSLSADQTRETQPKASKWSLLRHAAASSNRSKFLKKLEVHLKISRSLPPLHFLMSKADNVGICRKLLKYGADPLSYNKGGMNCLHLAAEYGRHNVMLLLLQHNYEGMLPIDQILNLPCGQPPNWTVLHYAAANDQAEVLSVLLDQVNIAKNATDAGGNTALMIACEKRSEKALEVLLENHAAVSTQNHEGKNCLSIAASKGYAEVVEKLLARAVDSRYHEELTQRGIEEGEHHFLNSRDAKGEIWTPLHHAAAHNHEEVLRQLAGHPDINIDARDTLKRTPLMVASESNHALAISILIRYFADVSLRDSSERTCLHAAASMGHTRVLATLLTIKNIDIDALDCNGNTALIIACEYGHTEAVKQILTRKYALRLVKQHSSTVPGKGFIPKNQLSTDSPAPLVYAQMVNKEGCKCLHMAASNGHVDVIQVLLGYQDLVDIDSQDDNGNTALILAAKHGETQAFQLILRRGANVVLCNAAGCNCLHAAAENGGYEVLKLLLEEVEDSECWSVQDSEVVKPARIAETAQAVWKKIDMGDILAWDIVRLQMMEKRNDEQLTCLHMAGTRRHIEIAILLLRAYLILALKVRGFTRHPRDSQMMPQFLTLVRDIVSDRHKISDSTFSDSGGLTQKENRPGSIQWIMAIEDIVVRSRLILFYTTYKHVDDQTRPSKYFALDNKVFGEILDDNLLVNTFVDAYMDFIYYCNAGDKEQRTFLHHIAMAGFREAGVEESFESSMTRLIESPAIDVNAVDAKGEMPLHLATETGNLRVVHHILQSGRTPYLTAENDKKNTPCSIAFTKWESEVLPNSSSSTDRSVEYKTILTLLENAVIKKIGEGSEVPLDEERLFLRLLFEHLEHSDPKWNSKWKNPFAKKLRGMTNLTRHRATFGGLTLLHYVAYRGLSEELMVLLSNSEYQLKVNIKCSFYNQTPLHFAVDKGQKEVVHILLRDDSEQVRTTDEDALGETPLEKAVKYKQNAATQSNEQEFNLYKEIEQMLMRSNDVKEYIDKLYKDRQVYVDASNAILVGAALIASVTFAGWLQPPLGYTDYTQYAASGTRGSGYESFAAVQQYPSVRAFCILNCLSFFFAVATVVCGAGTVLRMPSSSPSRSSVDVKRDVRLMGAWLTLTSGLMGIAIICVLGAFGAAGYAVLPPDIKYRTDLFITVSIGASTCVVCLYLFFRFCMNAGSEWFSYWRQRGEVSTSTQDYGETS